MEGNHCFNPAENCNRSGLEYPVDEYGHDVGICVIGGYTYYGKMFPSLYGYYLFGDWSGKLFYLLKDKKGDWQQGEVWTNGKNSNDIGVNINSFGEDEDGEIYIMTQSSPGPKSATGAIYRLGF